jgi:hypothetical protein
MHSPTSSRSSSHRAMSSPHGAGEPSPYLSPDSHASRRRRTKSDDTPASDSSINTASGASQPAATGVSVDSQLSTSSSATSSLRKDKEIELIPVSLIKAFLDTLSPEERSDGERLLRNVRDVKTIQVLYTENAFRNATIPFHLATSMVGLLDVTYGDSDLPQRERRFAIGPSLFKLRPKKLRSAATFGLYIDFDLAASEPVAFEHACGLAGLDCSASHVFDAHLMGEQIVI